MQKSVKKGDRFILSISRKINLSPFFSLFKMEREKQNRKVLDCFIKGNFSHLNLKKECIYLTEHASHVQ